MQTHDPGSVEAHYRGRMATVNVGRAGVDFLQNSRIQGSDLKTHLSTISRDAMKSIGEIH